MEQAFMLRSVVGIAMGIGVGWLLSRDGEGYRSTVFGVAISIFIVMSLLRILGVIKK